MATRPECMALTRFKDTLDSGYLTAGLLSITLAAASVSAILVARIFGVNWWTLHLVLLNATVWLLPLILLRKSGRLDLFHPLVYAALFYGFPMVVVKGLQLSFGGESLILNKTGDPGYFLNIALAWTAIGWTAAMAGYCVRPAARLGDRLILLPRYLASHSVRRPGLAAILLLGLAINLLLLRQGAYGSSLGEFAGSLTIVSVLRPLSLWFPMGLFLVVFAFVREKPPRGFPGLLILAWGLVLAHGFLSGSRAYLFTMTIIAAAAAFFARYPHASIRKLSLWFGAAILALAAGVVLVSDYRNMRQLEYGIQSLTPNETAGLMAAAIGENSERTLPEQSSLALERLLQRLNSVELLGLTFARAEIVRPAEQHAGIDNNILKDVFMGFVPRPLWPDKPLSGEFGLWFSRIYLESPHLTWSGPSVFGDLYRNFGFAGIPAGMFLLGIYLRVIHESLIRRSQGSPFSALLYIFLMAAINWEGTYSTFLTGGIRVFFSVLVLGVILRAAGALRRGDARLVSRTVAA